MELLVVMSIMVMLFVGGYTSYREYVRRQILANAADELKVNLAQARQKAHSGEKSIDCAGTFQGYKVTFSESSYTYGPSCTTSDPPANSSANKTINLPTGVTLSSTRNSVIFKAIAQGTDLTSSPVQSITLTLSYEAIGGDQEITINYNGTIE